jgi:hypothetical protein
MIALEVREASTFSTCVSSNWAKMILPQHIHSEYTRRIARWIDMPRPSITIAYACDGGEGGAPLVQHVY